MKLNQYGKQHIDQEDIDAVTKALKSDFLTTGPLIDEFEEAITQYIGCKHAIAVSNGTAALELAVQALQLQKGSEIITTPFTFMADTNCILYNNCKPVYADIDPKTGNIDPEDIEKKITPKTKAIITVDFGGLPCQNEKIKEIAKKHNLIWIEDGAHAVGGEFQGKKIGNIADMTMFSLHPVKTMTCGEGGIITTNNSVYAERMKILRNHGMVKGITKRYGEDAFYEYDAVMLGRNYRLTAIQAALGLSQLKKVDKFIDKRRQLVDLYNKYLKDIREIELPYENIQPEIRYSFHLYYIFLKSFEKNKFLERMREKGIGVHSMYIPTYNFTYHQNLMHIDKKEFPNTESVFERIVILPLFPDMNEEDILEVVKAVKESLKEDE